MKTCASCRRQIGLENEATERSIAFASKRRERALNGFGLTRTSLHGDKFVARI